MKLPKSKTGMYVVCRHEMGAHDGIPCGIFVTDESADGYAGACEQDMNDRGVTIFHFKVHYVMFYNE